MATLVSQREYARRKNWNPGYVAKLKSKGRIVLVPDGKGGELVDVEASDAKLAAEADPAKDYMAEVNADQRERHGKPHAAEVAAAAAAAAAAVDAAPRNGADPVVKIAQQARAKSLVFEAKARELAYEKQVGKLVDADAVRDAAYEKARIARKAIENIADRLSPQLAVETSVGRIYDLLMTEFRKVFEELAAGEEGQTRQ